MLKQAGLSVVEMLVGVAVGLFLLGGALKLFIDSINDSRRLMIETRVNQDLRAAADLIARDLRRAGYWQNALAGAASPPTINPYRLATPVAGAASSITYSFSRDGTENNVVDANETFGFRLNNNAVEVQVSNGNWQQVTDPTAVAVTSFAVTPVVREVPLGQFCTPACCRPTQPGCSPPTAPTIADANCPVANVRRFDIVLRGESTVNNTIVREIQESVRLRNDELPVAGCP